MTATSPDTPVLLALASLSSGDLLRFLRKQRWFGDKGAVATTARVVDAVVMPWGDGAFAIARVVVEEGNVARHYQLPVAARTVSNTDAIATVDIGGKPVVLFDAVHDDEFRRGLVDAVANELTAETNGLRWVAERTHPFSPSDSTKLGSAEQSNTSIRAGNVILKLFRTISPGVHPDVEVTRFLTGPAGFRNTPALRGVMRFEDGEGATTTGMVQDYLAGSSDAWTYALERGREYFAAPAGRDAANTFTADATRLGVITRAMHEALAGDDDDPAFEPEAVEPEDVDRWALRTQQSIREALALLERQIGAGNLPAERLPEARALIGRREHYLGWVNEIDDSLGDDVGMRIRVHGDYHLGQVLRTASNDFMIIDFEGEPSKSLEERRAKTSPLRDVAGMLRSFAYAAATLSMSVEKQLDAGTRELRAARWERDVRAAYLAGYLAPVDDETAEILPEDEAHVRHLIALFETEKAFYELAYELNNRPAWAWIPMRGISKLFIAK